MAPGKPAEAGNAKVVDKKRPAEAGQFDLPEESNT
jgi:hypothetical protein